MSPKSEGLGGSRSHDLDAGHSRTSPDSAVPPTSESRTLFVKCLVTLPVSDQDPGDVVHEIRHHLAAWARTLDAELTELVVVPARPRRRNRGHRATQLPLFG